MKFKLGDKVRMNPSCKVGKRYGLELLANMWFDDVRTIKSIDNKYIELEESCFTYTEEMFELVSGGNGACKYKVGDKVRVRKDLEHDTEYFMDGEQCGICAVEDMFNLVGKVVTITEIRDMWDNTHVYRIEGSDWNWCDGMFEGLAKEDPLDMKLEIGVDFIPTIPIVVVPIVTDEFTAKWMKDFVERNGGMAVNG